MDGLDNNSLSFDLPVYAVDSDGDDSVMLPLTVTIEDDVQGMSNGVLNIEEPTVADLAAGVVTTTTIDVMPEQSADGATITQFTYDSAVYTLDQTDTSEQEFIFTEGSLFITLEGDVRFEPGSALVSGADGLDDIRRLVQLAPDHLQTNGWLLFEHGWQQADAVAELLGTRGFEQVQSWRDLGGQQRVTGGQWRG